MLFSSLDLAPDLQKAIDACGYRTMTPIQQQAIVAARRGKDLLATAQTGTGKTAAFALPMLQQLCDKPAAAEPNSPRALVLTPTRELAEQLAQTIGRYAQFLPVKIVALYGGVKSSGQETKLNQGVDIVIATPGRLLEHLVKCSINLAKVNYLVLDEADRMLDMGFIGDVSEVIAKTNKQRQSLLFSATTSQAVQQLAASLLRKPQTISISRQNATAETVEHIAYAIDERSKPDLLVELINSQSWYQVLVFTSTKAQADTLMSTLNIVKISAALCHGDRTQGSRRRAIADFKSGKIQVLIATEVAARGLDIEGLDHVVNYNLPYLAEDYVHRIGRTGRAGRTGQAISLVSREEEQTLHTIERLIGSRIKRATAAGFEVGNRDTLIKKVAKSRYKPRTNKTSKTKIVDASRKP